MDVISTLRETVSYAQAQLGDGLLTFDIFDKNTGLTLIAYNENPLADALFSRLYDTMNSRFEAAHEISPLGDYYLLRIDGDRIVAVMDLDSPTHGFMLVDLKRASLGILLNIVLPEVTRRCRTAR